MSRSRNRVEHVEVIGQHSRGKQTLAEIGEGIHRIVDSREQHCLVEEGHTGRGERGQSAPDVVVDLVGVVGVHDYYRRQPEPADPRRQRPIDSSWEHDRQASVDSQPLEVGQRRQLSPEHLELRIGHRQWIATRKNDLGDGRIGGDPIDGTVPVRRRGPSLRVWEMSPEAVSAVNGAGAGHNHQGAPLIFVQDEVNR